MNQLKASIRTSAEVRTVEFLRAGWQQVHAQIPCTSANTASVYIETILLPGGAVGKVYHIAKIDSNRFTTELRADFGFDVCLDFLNIGFQLCLFFCCQFRFFISPLQYLWNRSYLMFDISSANIDELK